MHSEFDRLKDAETTSSNSAPDDLNKHETDILDYGISSQDAKCGSSFLRESAAKMHFSTAEASWKKGKWVLRILPWYVNMMDV